MYPYFRIYWIVNVTMTCQWHVIALSKKTEVNLFSYQLSIRHYKAHNNVYKKHYIQVSKRRNYIFFTVEDP